MHVLPYFQQNFTFFNIFCSPFSIYTFVSRQYLTPISLQTIVVDFIEFEILNYELWWIKSSSRLEISGLHLGLKYQVYINRLEILCVKINMGIEIRHECRLCFLIVHK